MLGGLVLQTGGEGADFREGTETLAAAFIVVAIIIACAMLRYSDRRMNRTYRPRRIDFFER